jgi:hypothetical protein
MQIIRDNIVAETAPTPTPVANHGIAVEERSN